MGNTTVVARLLTTLVLALSFVASIAPASAQVGGASIVIHKRLCPATFEGPDLFEVCHETPPPASVPFVLEGPDGLVRRVATDAAGDAQFVFLPAGTFTVREIIPAQFGNIRVFCALREDLGDPLAVTPLVSGFQLFVPENTDVVCDVFNIPFDVLITPDFRADPPGASVLIHKRLCPLGFEGPDFFEVCHPFPASGVPFVLEEGGGGAFQGTTNPTGNILFFGLEPGPVTVREAGADAGTPSRVFCSLATDLGTPMDVVQALDGFRFALPEGGDVVCDVFNLPRTAAEAPDLDPTGASVRIHKRVCPVGFEGPDFFEVCHAFPQPGVAFRLNGLRTVTDEAGNALFFDLVEGTFTITEETIPGEFAGFRVFCALREDLGDPLDVTPLETGFRLFVPEDTDIICDVFNIPAAPRG